MTTGDSAPASKAVVMGVPFDANSSFLRGPALAPARIRAALRSGSMNLCIEDGRDLEEMAAHGDWRDAGDLALGPGAAAFADIERAIGSLSSDGARILTLGGDHSITYPIVRAVGPAYPGLSILHIDAHPDLYDEFEGSRISHATPFARIMEEGLAARLTQVGIRAMNGRQRAQAERFGVEVVAMRDFRPGMALNLLGPVYVSLDLDALDPAFAPGVSHHEPGGLSVRDALTLLWSVTGTIIGADIVEYNPTRDHAEMTAMVAAKFYKELLGLLLR